MTKRKNKKSVFVKADKEVDVRDKIVKHVKEEEERNLRWLSRKTEINYSTLYAILVDKFINLSEENLLKINTVLGTDFIK